MIKSVPRNDVVKTPSEKNVTIVHTLAVSTCCELNIIDVPSILKSYYLYPKAANILEILRLFMHLGAYSNDSNLLFPNNTFYPSPLMRS